MEVCQNPSTLLSPRGDPSAIETAISERKCSGSDSRDDRRKDCGPRRGDGGERGGGPPAEAHKRTVEEGMVLVP